MNRFFFLVIHLIKVNTRKSIHSKTIKLIRAKIFLILEEDYEILIWLGFVYESLTFEYIMHINNNIEYYELFLDHEDFRLRYKKMILLIISEGMSLCVNFQIYLIIFNVKINEYNSLIN